MIENQNQVQKQNAFDWLERLSRLNCCRSKKFTVLLMLTTQSTIVVTVFNADAGSMQRALHLILSICG